MGEYPNVASEPLDFEEGLKIDVSAYWGGGGVLTGGGGVVICV